MKINWKGCVSAYRYGFNGKENDPETKYQDYGMRMYNTRLARFFGVDPLTKDYPELTPYQFASNTPIQATDLDGGEAWFIHGTWSSPKTFSALGAVNYKPVLTAFHNQTKILYSWSGDNTSMARTFAARALAVDILMHKDNTQPISLIGHSHGGNVAIEAINILVQYGYNGSKINLLTINTPVRADYQLSMQAREFVNHYHIFDPQDPVAPKGGNQYFDHAPQDRTDPRWPLNPSGKRYTEKIPWKAFAWNGEHGPAGLVFPGAYNFEDYPHSVATLTYGLSDKYHDSHNNPGSWATWLNMPNKPFYSNYLEFSSNPGKRHEGIIKSLEYNSNKIKLVRKYNAGIKLGN